MHPNEALIQLITEKLSTNFTLDELLNMQAVFQNNQNSLKPTGNNPARFIARCIYKYESLEHTDEVIEVNIELIIQDFKIREYV